LTNVETADLYKAVASRIEGAPFSAKVAGPSAPGIGEFFAPIGSESGARFLNIPEKTGLDNRTFQTHIEAAVKDVFERDGRPSGTVTFHAADSGYLDVDWKGLFSGQDYRAGAPSGRPDLQRRSADLLSTLGPRIAEIQDRYAKQYGWTPNPAVRLWEREGFEGNAGAVIPSPPTPWRQSEAIAPEVTPPPATAPP
jgi:hypothetical protein